MRRNPTVRTYDKGRLAECLVAILLFLKGYRVLCTRFKTACGEVDIVAVKGRTVFFVEVKYRSTYTRGLESVALPQRRRVVRAADVFLSRHVQYLDYDVCFDVVVCCPWRWPLHLGNAFRKGGEL